MVILSKILLKIIQIMKLREKAIKLNFFEKSWWHGILSSAFLFILYFICLFFLMIYKYVFYHFKSLGIL